MPHGSLASVRGPLLVLTWIVATVLATGLAWAGVRSVVDDVAAPLPVPAATTGLAGPTEAPPASEPSPEPSPSTSEPESPSEQSEPVQPAETVRSFEVYGGTATVSFSPTGVEVLSAVPKPGFSADVEPEHTGMRVEFESDDHRSRLDVWWNGEPRHEVEERDDDSGDDSGGGPGEDDDGGDHEDD